MKLLHIELTNRCTLECPACPRTVWKNTTKHPIKKADLDIEQLASFLDCPGGKEIEKFILCGDYGDSIYYPKLIEFIKYFRSRKFEIFTNGSLRDENFWIELSNNLTNQDTIIFAIDGLEDTNHLYRKNTNWDSIMLAVDIMSKSPVRVIWKTIVFSFNYDKLGKIQELANLKGAEFVVEKTHRYGEESLVPPDHLINQQVLYQKEFNKIEPIDIKPRCMSKKVVTSDGYFLPCHWIRSPMTFFKSDLWKHRDIWFDRMSINKINYDQGLDLIKQWSDTVLQKGINGGPNLDVLCKMKCRAGCEQDDIWDDEHIDVAIFKLNNIKANLFTQGTHV
jgi:MoaA/NifB/PqqE/SkfB family radical SAM enzyme